MPKRSAPLNAKQLERLRPDPHRTLELIDGSVPGLRVRLSPSGEKSWSLSARIGGIRRRVALGKNLGLADARRQAEHIRSAIAKGENPAEVRKAVLARRKDAAQGMGTFGSVIKAYYEQGPGEALRSGLTHRRVSNGRLVNKELGLARQFEVRSNSNVSLTLESCGSTRRLLDASVPREDHVRKASLNRKLG
jgi:Arm DNA-binding domain